MAIRRISLDIDFDRLDFEKLARISAAIAELERAAADGDIVISISQLQGAGKFRRDRKPEPIWARPLQPMPKKVLAALSSEDWLTVNAIAELIGIKSNSVRPTLGLLHKRGNAEFKKDGKAKLWRRV